MSVEREMVVFLLLIFTDSWTCHRSAVQSSPVV